MDLAVFAPKYNIRRLRMSELARSVALSPAGLTHC